MYLSDRIEYKLSNTKWPRRIYGRLGYNNMRKKHNSNGDYPEKVFYIIRIRYDNVGIFGYLRYVLTQCLEAEKKGWIPVVDMQNGVNAYQTKESIGRKNTWEYFFEQPAGYTLSQIGNAENIVLAPLFPKENWDLSTQEIYDVCAKYIRFKPEIEQEIQKRAESWKEKKILGIKLRGTDYMTTQPKYHSKQPAIEESLKRIDEMLEKHQFSPDLIFLATEDTTIAEAVKKRYGDKLIMNDIQRFSHSDVWYETDLFKSNAVSMGKDYCLEIGLLTRCNALIATGSQGTLCSIIMNNHRYEFTEEISNGEY